MINNYSFDGFYPQKRYSMVGGLLFHRKIQRVYDLLRSWGITVDFTVLSCDVTAEQMRDRARMMDIEYAHITKDTTPEKLEEELLVMNLAWRLKVERLIIGGRNREPVYRN